MKAVTALYFYQEKSLEKFKHYNKLVVDADWVVFAAASAGEKRSIQAVLKSTGEEWQFKSRTELWGRRRVRDGGFLQELNKERESAYTWEDFDVCDVQTPDALPNVLHTAKMMVNNLKQVTGVKDVELYVGEGKSWRHERSTILEYKSNRVDNIIPIYKEDVKQYLIKHQGATLVKNLEVDDVVVIKGCESDKTLVVSVDKDSMGCPISLYNPTHPEWGVMNCRGLGRLWWDTSGKVKKVRGVGRKFLYWQWLNGDKVDAIEPRAASEASFGEAAAYNTLVDCKNDAECIQAVKDTYQYFYQKPVTIIGWRGDKIRCDWLYVANEMLDLVRMKRSYEDNVTATDIFRKFGML